MAADFDGYDMLPNQVQNYHTEETMLNKAALIGNIASKAGKMFGGEKSQARDDFEQNLKAMLTSALSKLDLVTRDEFDTQATVLHHTRTRLEALEKRVSELEQQNTSGSDEPEAEKQ